MESFDFSSEYFMTIKDKEGKVVSDNVKITGEHVMKINEVVDPSNN